MAKSLPLSPVYFHVTPLPFHYRHGWQSLPPYSSHRTSYRVRLNYAGFPQLNGLDSLFDLDGISSRIEGLLFTLADSVLMADASTSETAGAAAVQRNKGLFGLIPETMEVVLKALKDVLSAFHVPYSYGFAIILLTVIVKAATFPLTKKQVESTLAMQNLQPKIKAIQEKYGGNQERIQLETTQLYKQVGMNPLAGLISTLATLPVWIGLYQALYNVANEGLLTEGFFWIPSLGGPATIDARRSGSGISWLIPFVDGHPPLGWSDTAAYLALPLLLIVTQYVSTELMKPPPQTVSSSKNTNFISKFFPLMIGYFSLSVPSGLSIYWLTNNVLSTAQQLWLRKFGGASKSIVRLNEGGTIGAGPSKQSERAGERFKQLKEDERRKMQRASSQVDGAQILDSDSESDEGELTMDQASGETYVSSTGSKGLPNYSGPSIEGKLSKRKKTVQ